MPFTTKPLDLLVIEDNDGDYVLFETYLHQSGLSINRTDRITTLAAVNDKAYDIIFLDLSLPDSGGIESFVQLNRLMPEIPIVVLTGNNDGKVARECIQLGAQDYLVKDDLTEILLEKSVHFSIERKKNLEKLNAINKQYELIANITNDIIWYWNIESNEISARKNELFGYTKEMMGRNIEWWMEKVHPEDRVRVLHAFEQVITRKVSTAQEEFRLRAADGNYLYVFNRVRLQPQGNNLSNLLIGAMMDITESKKLQEDLIRTQLKAQKQIAEASLLAQEKQKEEIGKELHDNINQILAAINLYLDIALQNGEIREELIVKSKGHTISAINEIRRLSHSLMPPTFEGGGLKDALKTLTDELQLTGLFSIQLLTSEFDEGALDNQKKTMLYRIVQEQMNNIIKYAKASEVNICLKTLGGGVTLAVADNGVGFDTTIKSKGIGFRNIESRVSYYTGKMQLLSSPGEGTLLKVFLPI